MYLWLGRKVDSALLSALFGVSSIEQVDPAMVIHRPFMPNPLARAAQPGKPLLSAG